MDEYDRFEYGGLPVVNAILRVQLIIVPSTGSVINGAFGLLIIANSNVGIVQELGHRRDGRCRG